MIRSRRSRSTRTARSPPSSSSRSAACTPFRRRARARQPHPEIGEIGGDRQPPSSRPSPPPPSPPPPSPPRPRLRHPHRRRLHLPALASATLTAAAFCETGREARRDEPGAAASRNRPLALSDAAAPSASLGARRALRALAHTPERRLSCLDALCGRSSPPRSCPMAAPKLPRRSCGRPRSQPPQVVTGPPPLYLPCISPVSPPRRWSRGRSSLSSSPPSRGYPAPARPRPRPPLSRLVRVEGAWRVLGACRRTCCRAARGAAGQSLPCVCVVVGTVRLSF